MAYKDPLDPRNREAKLRHYRANKQQYVARNKVKEQQLRDIVIEAKKVPCIDCGVSYPHYVMDSHHRDPSEKEDVIATLVKMGNESRLRAELAKCDIICANCHRIRTWGPGGTNVQAGLV